MPQKSTYGLRKSGGFSLVELILVVAVIVLMMSLLLPAVSGFTSTSGRRGAVNILMNTFEQARVAALESGQNVYVGFANDSLPDDKKDMYYAAFIVFREATDEEKLAAGKKVDETIYIILKKWTRLPKNIAFKRADNTLVPENAGVAGIGVDISALNRSLSSGFQISRDLPGVVFNNSGSIQNGEDPLQFFLYEGYFNADQDNYTRDANKLFEKITFSRYTGRSQLDVSALPTP